MGQKQIYEKHLKKLPSTVEWLGFREVQEKSTSIGVKDSQLESFSRSESSGVMVEAMVNGQLAYAASSELTESGIQRAVDAAVERAQRASKFLLFPMSSKLRPLVDRSYQSDFIQNYNDLKPDQLVEKMQKCTDKMKISPKIIRRFARLYLVEVETSLYSSSGSRAQQKFKFTSSSLEAIAQDGPVVQKRSDGGFAARSRQGGLEVWLHPELESDAVMVAEQAVELTTAESCPTGAMDLILMPDQMMLQIHESIGHPLELDRILGDERNYAGWSFVKLEDFGKLQYGSSKMNVSFDPTIRSEFASYAFDDTGLEAKSVRLIENGLLLKPLGGIESQQRTKMKGVANQRASSWNRPPIDRMANLNLEPGTSTLADMISKIENGVLMESNRSWSIDDFRNKFQFGCEYGKKIENGKITKTLRNPNYRGTTLEFWRGLQNVGDDKSFEIYGTPFCGKGEPNQVIRVGHASPPCHFSKVEVFGGA